jgi:hypothetical protein
MIVNSGWNLLRFLDGNSVVKQSFEIGPQLCLIPIPLTTFENLNDSDWNQISPHIGSYISNG